ncbi:bifunctional ADP-dependent NAD(P)H-hydrate dehydratase/NAD(P)H-hydrate epimerase [Taibaiella sp. KBW10]|uniref:NAD(P)H-hydrate dehydratase n=1 Tax=Taibaiella sp. KBW10 TaxID=2153357 RepID=UPI000F59228F|nr:NAD(P)H-hydrate dehydratase [Taibaiella sp. KBW10]RQO32452.1 bifunctional ADP-dependent NAD(P)H-hydrate dehydratase/NAD(P)H-hydrate epimerase [Taibaiella sp. KBW10]
MHLYTAEQLKRVDAHTVQVQNMSTLALMERAAKAFTEALIQQFSATKPVFAIICGKGNNGGDGLAIARLLHQQKYKVQVYLLEAPQYTADNFQNQKRLSDHNIAIHFFSKEDHLMLPADAVVLDGLFGYGLRQVLDDSWQALIQQINKAACILAIDLPSGLMADVHTPDTAPVVQAHYTLTFQVPKLALLQPENQDKVGLLQILNLQLDDTCFAPEVFHMHYIEEALVQRIRKPRKPYTHKGTYGHSLLIGGSYGKVGAVLLSGKAALRSGCGLVSLYTPKCAYAIVQNAFPEAMVRTDEQTQYISSFPDDIAQLQAIGIGMGLGQEKETELAFLEWLAAAKEELPPLVIDADGLNILATHKEYLKLLPAQTILTPHPKELQRLIGTWEHDFEKLQKCKAFAQAHQLIVLIKGAHTVVVLPDGQLYFNSTGNAGMATGGSGDVLSGMLTALRAQGYTATEAAIMGVWLHGRAGDLAALDLSMESLIAGDIIAYLPKAFLSLTSKTQK